MEMAIKNHQNLIEFLKTTKFPCAYELIVLFAAIKLKSAEGRFNKEQVTDFFIEFYRIREVNNLVLEEKCNPLLTEDRKETILFLNRNPISSLLKVGILKTFERFNPDIFKIIFDHSEEILSTLKDQIIEFYLESCSDSREIMEDSLSKWETGIDESIKADALVKMSGSIEKINLEFMLKYLYQSYSLTAFNKLLKSFKIDEQDFESLFTGGVEVSSKFFKNRAPEGPAEIEEPSPETEEIPAEIEAPSPETEEGPAEIEEPSPEIEEGPVEIEETPPEIEEEPAIIEEEPAVIKEEQKISKQSPGHIQELTNFFQKMREEAEEEQEKSKSKKKQKK